MGLLSLQEALSLEMERANQLYARHLNPGLYKIYRMLGIDDLDVASAEGAELTLRDGRRILDFSAAIGVLGVGHNHPRVVAAERLCLDRKVLDAMKVAPTKLQGALAYNLSQMLPGPLEVAFFAVSGAEAVEAALKLCEKAQGPGRRKFITTTGSYHGKTHGALALTDGGGFRRGFLMGIAAENVLTLPFGDLEAGERLLTSPVAPECIAFIVEAVQGQAVVEAPPGYLLRMSELCRKSGVLVIFDEVKAGMGRCGTFCAFEADGVTPDVVTLSKGLGGGKHAIAAMVSSRELFERAYGKRQDCALHTSTYSGLGSACAVAIETLNVYRDEQLIERAAERGKYLRGKLEELRSKHAGKILELRGRGLFQAIRFDFKKSLLGAIPGVEKSGVFTTLDSALMAATVRELYRHYNIIVHFSASNPDVLHIMPPLIVTEAQIDVFVAAIDDLLARGLARVMASFVGGNLRGLLP